MKRLCDIEHPDRHDVGHEMIRIERGHPGTDALLGMAD